MTSHQIKSETVLLLVWRFVSVSRASGGAGAGAGLCVISRSLMSFNEDFPLQIGFEPAQEGDSSYVWAGSELD